MTLDFYEIRKQTTKNGVLEVFPNFIISRSKDLMIKGGDFYAVWDETSSMWSTDIYKVKEIIDNEVLAEANALKPSTNGIVKPLLMRDNSTKLWKEFTNYIATLSDHYVQLDSHVTFMNDNVVKEDYVSKRVNYALAPGSIYAYDELMSTLYAPGEREKIEWAIGSIVEGDAKDIQKFLVLYGEAGTGKSTVLHIIEKLFNNYYTSFEANAITSRNNTFATEAFKDNPLVALQHDGDLSKIEDNSKLNSIVSHEDMTMNEKYKSAYMSRVNCFLFMGTNKAVKITDAKSGIIRRLIDVEPTGKKIPVHRYNELYPMIDHELGAIAHHCHQVYLSLGKNYYSKYIPTKMLTKTDYFYNFMEDNYFEFKSTEGIFLADAFAMYEDYCDKARLEYRLNQKRFRDEFENYFEEYIDRKYENGKRRCGYFKTFITSKFEIEPEEDALVPVPDTNFLNMDYSYSLLDNVLASCPAQLANKKGTPSTKWEDTTTTLFDINTSEVHFVKPPDNHIVIDFDLKDDKGNKSMALNLQEASKWYPTYAEFSKSGGGIHLHYIYTGDISQLSKLYAEDVEIKVFTGNSSLRRKLSKCNNVEIAEISSGLPLREEKAKMINDEAVKTEQHIRNLIDKALRKEVHPNTKSNVDFIYKILEDAYDSGSAYDVMDMQKSVLNFAMGSTNQSLECIKLVNKMKFRSKEGSSLVPDSVYNTADKLVFFDVEVFPNLFIIVWKTPGSDCVRMINPTPEETGRLLDMKLVGFNCRRYDNHILYARARLRYSNEQLYYLSQKIVSSEKGMNDHLFREAFNISYTDVYDFASAANKKSLKKFEIELGIHHQELGLPWDQPVPEEKWIEAAEYCDNDVIATEAVFNHLSGDWTARQILADVSGMTVNTKTNDLTKTIIFEGNKTPQNTFFYRNLAEPIKELPPEVEKFLRDHDIIDLNFDLKDEHSLLPYFPGYTYDGVKSVYRDEVVGEGGYVYSEPGMYSNVALLDVASMHPTSCITECHFGPKYTKMFKDVKDSRVCIKHEDYESAKQMLNGKLTPYLGNSTYEPSDLANALKTAINSVYGLTSASFPNEFKHPKNVDNIVAKRGALFMIDLKYAVQEKGFTVAHIKTDSIKIPDATPEIIQFVMDFGKKYGYDFEHEATYDRMCLVNRAVYIAKYSDKDICESLYGYVPGDNKKKSGKWTATGAQFAHPYIFKTMFSKEPLEFADMCEAKSVKTAIYEDFNEDLSEDQHSYTFVGKIGNFCPIAPGKGGALLLRQATDKEGNEKYDAVTGTKDFRWMESEMVEKLGKQDDIDIAYFNKLVDEAYDSMAEYGDVEWFLN